jgi:hypothetical protein
MRLKGFLISDVKTLLFLINELNWIKGEDKGMFVSLKGIVSSKRVKVGWIISTQYLHVVLFRVNLCLMISPALLLRCGHACAKNLLGDGTSVIASNQGQTQVSHFTVSTKISEFQPSHVRLAK